MTGAALRNPAQNVPHPVGGEETGRGLTRRPRPVVGAVGGSLPAGSCWERLATKGLSGCVTSLCLTPHAGLWGARRGWGRKTNLQGDEPEGNGPSVWQLGAWGGGFGKTQGHPAGTDRAGESQGIRALSSRCAE